MTDSRTPAGDRWRTMLDVARGQALRLGDPDWQSPDDPYAERVDSFRAGRRTDDNLVDLIAEYVSADQSVLEVGAGAGRLSVPLARRVHEVVALEPNDAMADALQADARSAGVSNLRVLHAGWDSLQARVADAAFAAHVVYSLPDIEAFIQRLDRSADTWCAIVAFAEAPQSRVTEFWSAVFGEPRLPRPHLPQVLDVAWSLGLFPELRMLDVPVWPLGPIDRARSRLRWRLHVAPGSPADQRLEHAMADLLVDWGDGVLGPRDRRPLPIGIVHWRPRV